MTPARYAIHLANLAPVIGREIAKTQPVVVVSPEAMNAHAGTVVVCPLTSTLHPGWRSRVTIRCAGRPPEIAVDQIRTISTRRLGRRIDSLSADAAARVRALIQEMYAQP